MNNLKLNITKFLNNLINSLITKFIILLNDPSNIQTFSLWTSAIVAALISVIYAKLFRLAEAGFYHLLEKNDHQPYLIFFVSPLLFVLAWYVVKRFAPEASGSGIPQIMAANEMSYTENKAQIDRLLSLKTASVKVVSSLLCVLGGGAIGREGPTLQICTSIFHFFGQQVRRFIPHVGEHTLVVAGAAAGLASAFNTPLGGIVYAIEELGLVHFHKVRTALLSGVIFSGLVAQWILGSYLYLGFPPLAPVGFSILHSALICGAITGVAGAGFGRLLFIFLNQRLSIKKITHLGILSACCGLIMAVLSYFNEQSSGTGVNVIMGFLFNQTPPSLILFISRYLATTISYLSGAAGGIFSPSLAMGGSLGAYVGHFIAPGHPNLMVLLGMIGFLTGVTRTPFTAFILVLEMTDRHSAIFPMMIAALTAHWIARLVESNSFYENVKHRYLA